MKKYMLRTLVLLVVFTLLSMATPSVSAGDEPNGKPFLALSDRIVDLESRSDDWDTAYGWGDHSIAGYLTSESDPIFTGSAAYGITSTKISNWDTAYGWGDHSAMGYLTSYTETDPIFSASPAVGITTAQITNWDTAYGWGDHASAGYLTSYSETDPQVGINTINYIPKWDGSKLVTGTIYDNGKIGIGTTNPDEMLEVNGKIKADELVYDTPRTHYFFLGGEAFQPASDVAYSSDYGWGGAHINSGSGGLVAPVNLPYGAKVTEFRVYFKDDSTSTMTVKLQRFSTTGGYWDMAKVDSSGISSYGNKADTSISLATIDSAKYPYHIYAYCSAWDGDKLEIFGARITYTISEAE